MTHDEGDSLKNQIADAQARRAARDGKKANADNVDGDTTAAAYALRYGAEFAVCVAVGIGIGALIDHFAGTGPWGILIMLGFGLAAGIMGVIRAYREMVADLAAKEIAPDSGNNEEA